MCSLFFFFFFQTEDGIRDLYVTGVQTCALPIYLLFRHIIYKPIDQLLFAMSRAEAGDLAAEVEPSAPDEIGLLTSRFNRMRSEERRVGKECRSRWSP